MSDRTDEDPDAAEPVSVDAAGIDLVGDHTVQLEVTLPVEHAEDDRFDDDGVELTDADGSAMEFAADELPEDDVPADDTFAHDVPADAVHAEDVPDEDSLPAEAPSEVEPVAHEVAGPEEAPADSMPEPEVAVVPAPAVTVPAPASAVTSPSTGAVPTLRRHLVDTAPLTLAARREGEREAEREKPELLTADRLVAPDRSLRAEPAGTWPHLVYRLSGRRIRLADSRGARERKELDAQIAAPITGGARFVAVLSRKGGVGKTTVTALLGMALADAREDRVIAIDANPDRGTLADRVGGAGGKTVRDLSRTRLQVHGFNELSAVVARDRTRLDVLASDADPRVSDAFSDHDYRDVADVAAHYYSIVLTDTGTGIVHSVMDATLDCADELVVVAGLSLDEARLASETLTWLETNGYGELARRAVVVLNTSRPGTPMVRAEELEGHFATRVRAVVRLPYDAQVATGGTISFADLQPATRHAARQLAKTVVEDLASGSAPARA